MTPKAKEVGYRIRKIRESKDLNQQNMAGHLDITPGAYAKIERGETDPSISRLYEIAAILKVDIMHLLQDAPNSNTPVITDIQNQIDMLSKEVIDLKKIVKKTLNKKWKQK